MSVEMSVRDGLHKPINRLAGIVATFDTFDTDPTTPANITDGNFATETGEGIKALAAAGTVGNTKFDMGTVHPVLVIVWANIHKASGDGTIGIYIDHSDDGSTWLNSNFAYSGGKAATNDYTVCGSAFVYARYIRVRVTTVTAPTGASVFHAKFAEVMALQLFG